ncbi:MAG: adenylosuccinate lyase [Bacilli bacterium]
MIKRYSSPELDNIWNDENKFRKFLEIELASLEAYTKLKIIPKEDFDSIKKNAIFSLERIQELEKVTKHDVIAFTRCVSESLGEEKKWFHYSLTSSDVVDSAQALMLRDANDILDEDIQKLLKLLKKKALRYQDLPCIGRTHGMHGEVTSFGLKYALYYDELVRDYDRFQLVRDEVEVIKLSGAMGNFAEVNPKVEVYVAKKLGLDYAEISTQVLSRDRIAHYIMVLALIASLLEKIATEVRLLSQSEIHEVEEHFDEGQKGSSAMPHKRNPIASENIVGCARLIRSYINPVIEDNALWHERDISHSSVERVILPDATTLLHYMLKRYTKVIDELTVFPKKMQKNIDLTNGVIYSSRVLEALIKKGCSREEAYDLIQPLAFKSYNDDISFKDLIIKSKVATYLNKKEIDGCFLEQYFLRNVKVIYQRLGIEE